MIFVMYSMRKAQEASRGETIYEQRIWPKFVNWIFIAIALGFLAKAGYTYAMSTSGIGEASKAWEDIMIAVSFFGIYYCIFGRQTMILSEEGITRANVYLPWGAIHNYRYEKGRRGEKLYLSFEAKNGRYRTIALKNLKDTSAFREMIDKKIDRPRKERARSGKKKNPYKKG